MPSISSTGSSVNAPMNDNVILKLFERGQAYTPILQKIFLYLDPKSLKNCKLTCSQWKDFIDREIWGSSSAKRVLESRLLTNWKDEDFVEVSKINLEIKATGFDCDEDVIVICGEFMNLICVYNA